MCYFVFTICAPNSTLQLYIGVFKRVCFQEIEICFRLRDWVHSGTDDDCVFVIQTIWKTRFLFISSRMTCLVDTRKTLASHQCDQGSILDAGRTNGFLGFNTFLYYKRSHKCADKRYFDQFLIIVFNSFNSYSCNICYHCYFCCVFLYFLPLNCHCLVEHYFATVKTCNRKRVD